MKWRIFLAKDNLTKTIIISIFILIFLISIRIYFGAFWTLFSAIFLFITLNSYFLPLSYEFTEEEVIIRKFYYTQRRPWKEFKKYILTTNGVILSPFKKKTFLDNFRGVHLLLPKNKDRVIDFIERKLKSS